MEGESFFSEYFSIAALFPDEFEAVGLGGVAGIELLWTVIFSASGAVDFVGAFSFWGDLDSADFPVLLGGGDFLY